MVQYQAYLDFAVQTVREAGKISLKYFQTSLQLELKPDRSLVTVADREVENHIREQLESRFPTHTIVGEEFGEKQGEENYRWFIDPIDGTRSFVRGVPLYSVLVGLEIEGESRVGVAYFPALNEVIYAASGLGCWWNGRRAAVSSQDRLEKALVAHADTTSFKRHAKGAAWERLQKATGYRAGWCDAYAYLLVATGRAEIAIDPKMHSWDCAPFPVILSEAGGYFGDWRGNSSLYAGEAVATNRALLPQVLELLAG